MRTKRKFAGLLIAAFVLFVLLVLFLTDEVERLNTKTVNSPLTSSLSTSNPAVTLESPDVALTSTPIVFSEIVDLARDRAVEDKVTVIVRRVDGTYVKLLVAPETTMEQLPLNKGDIVEYTVSPKSMSHQEPPLPTQTP